MMKSPIISMMWVMALCSGVIAQVPIGEASLNLSGSVNVGYNDSNSNFAVSSHELDFGGQANLSGSYYDPNFLSFTVQPFANQSRANSDYRSVESSSGVGAALNLFGGSSFPASITYSKAFNSAGSFDIPGSANFTTHGDMQQIGARWGEHLRDMPTVDVTFTDGSGAYSYYGLDTEGTSHNKIFSVASGYRIAGFILNGQYEHTNTEATIPEITSSDIPSITSNTNGNSLTFGASHKLPFHGAFSATISRAAIGSSEAGTEFDTTIDTVGTGVSFNLLKTLSVGTTAFYDDNLEGSIYNSLVNTGAVLPGYGSSQSSHSLGIDTYATYDIPSWNLHLRATADHQQQSFAGHSLSDNVYQETASYSAPLLRGYITATAGMTESFVNSSNSNSKGLIASVTYNRQFGRLNVSGGGNYSQDTQTVLIGYTNSGYSYSGTLGYLLGQKSFLGVTASGAQSLLSNVPGTGNSSQNYSTSLSFPHISFNAGYSKSKGNSILTATGLVATPVPPVILPSSALVLYNGTSYSGGIGAHPTREFMITASFAKALSDTLAGTNRSSNGMTNFYLYSTYRFRRVEIVGGYSKLGQMFSLSGLPVGRSSEIYIGISRWFNFF